MPHTDDYTFIGNIVTTVGDNPSLSPAKIEISDLGEFSFANRFFIIDGPKWRASDIEYDFETLSRKRLTHVNSYKAFWKIKARFMGRHTYATIAELESLMEQVQHVFTDTGVITPRRFFFSPPGDYSRPVIEVIKASDPTIDIEHFGGKYIGYGLHEIVIESVNEFDRKILPRTEPFPELPDDGMVACDGMYISLEL